jgi:trk system potassium uptake protein TrkH
VGPALGETGPVDNYSAIPSAGKWVLVLCMLIGRLEIYTVILLFIPIFWKK